MWNIFGHTHIKIIIKFKHLWLNVWLNVLLILLKDSTVKKYYLWPKSI